MHDPLTDAERLASYADILAGELPGFWSSTHVPPSAQTRLASLTDRVWDLDLVAASLAEHPLRQAAVLSRADGGAQLLLLDRHDADRGVLAAALALPGLPVEAYRGVPEPNGVALDGEDPFSGAEVIARDLLPRYEQALSRAHGNARDQGLQPTVLTMAWQADGSLHAEPATAAATQVLLANGFAEAENAPGVYQLVGDDSAVQARAVRRTGRQLAELGIGTALSGYRSSPPPTSSPAPSTTPRPSRTR
ncbi:hypothetical protein [Streptomyces sp. GZWMJZ-114]|uniref:hypothetical protein n=1 Tax=Streptomyces sp. GZWMJZ-114 TaxID=2494734 RepID=UPI001011BE96|nr:hypothetical protein [Streptomyces sp. GZWMJZ-114]